MKIVIDLDGTICELKKDKQDYGRVKVNPGAVKKIKALKKAGHYIILQTARHMETCGFNQGRVVAKIGKKTLDWLEKSKIPYDEIYFGKPNADIYIDDLAYKFTGWEEINPEKFENEKFNILIPMAGAGSRFNEAGFKNPKPLIDVKGEPMMKWALKSMDFLNNLKNFKLIFVILSEHEKKYKMEKNIKSTFPELKNHTLVIKIDKLTRGQAETCLAAEKYIDNNNRLIIHNCDTYSTSNLLEVINSYDPDGVLPCFKSSDPRYSFARLDKYDYVAETAEKKPISNWASNGTYYFKRGSDFVWAAKKSIRDNKMAKKEYYVSSLYNELIKTGKKIRIATVDKNFVLGTPEELKNFLK